jgi:hypothetical protein
MCWSYCGFSSGNITEINTPAGTIYGFRSRMSSERKTRVGYIAGWAARWLQRGTHVLDIFMGLAA